jgi:hypothetical protein
VADGCEAYYHPRPLFDREAGNIDLAVAKYRCDHWDIPGTYVRRNAERLRPVLNGKIHLIIGRRQLRLPFTSEPKESPAFWPRRSYDFDVWSEKRLREKLNYKHEIRWTRKLVTHPKDGPGAVAHTTQ